MVLLEITGQKFAICCSISSRFWTFFAAFKVWQSLVKFVERKEIGNETSNVSRNPGLFVPDNTFKQED